MDLAYVYVWTDTKYPLKTIMFSCITGHTNNTTVTMTSATNIAAKTHHINIENVAEVFHGIVTFVVIFIGFRQHETESQEGRVN